MLAGLLHGRMRGWAGRGRFAYPVTSPITHSSTPELPPLSTQPPTTHPTLRHTGPLPAPLPPPRYELAGEVFLPEPDAQQQAGGASSTRALPGVEQHLLREEGGARRAAAARLPCEGAWGVGQGCCLRHAGRAHCAVGGTVQWEHRRCLCAAHMHTCTRAPCAGLAAGPAMDGGAAQCSIPHAPVSVQVGRMVPPHGLLQVPHATSTSSKPTGATP